MVDTLESVTDPDPPLMVPVDPAARERVRDIGFARVVQLSVGVRTKTKASMFISPPTDITLFLVMLLRIVLEEASLVEEAPWVSRVLSMMYLLMLLYRTFDPPAEAINVGARGDVLPNIRSSVGAQLTEDLPS